MSYAKIKEAVIDFENFELHHKVLAFSIVFCITILLARTVTLIYDPNPTIASFELHHFDYGILLLMVVSLLMLFGKKRYSLYLFLSAIAFAWILDNLWFIRKVIVDSTKDTYANYLFTLPSVIILTIVALLAAILIDYFKKTKKK